MGTAASHQPLCSSLPRPVGVSLYPPTENGFPKLNSVKPGILNTSQNSGFRSVVIAQNNRSNSAKKEVVECTPEDDGYRWRKYGRKSVKGNQFPRSYYKCTQPNCQVKKQVETVMVRGKPEVHTTYKGEHNHEAPQVTRLNAQDQLSFKNSVMTEFLHSEGKFNGRMLSSSNPTPQSRSLSNSSGGLETVKAGLMATHSPKLSQLAALVASDLDSLIKNTNSSVSNGSDEEMDIDTRVPATSPNSIPTPIPTPTTTRTNPTRASRLSTNSEKISLPRKRPLNQSSPALTIKSEYSYPTTPTNVEGLFRVKSESKTNSITMATSESESAGEGNSLADFSDSNDGSTQTTANDDSFSPSPSFFPNLASSGPSSNLTLSSSGSPLSTSSNSPLLSERSTKTTNNAVPRLVVETNANVDFLDDGYHWRKYGQKNVKGSRYPRSYYKCTEKNCPVKKQVEQSGNTMINTYEGTHTHKAPGLDDNLKKRRKRRRTDCSDGTAS